MEQGRLLSDVSKYLDLEITGASAALGSEHTVPFGSGGSLMFYSVSSVKAEGTVQPCPVPSSPSSLPRIDTSVSQSPSRHLSCLTCRLTCPLFGILEWERLMRRSVHPSERPKMKG
ncbi:hypothetical protein AOLI_G00065140 [Acnodon oligacanthus]